MIAAALISVWQEIEAVLAPIIGQRGFVALYQRSIYLTCKTYPWMAGSAESAPAALDLTPLQTLLTSRSTADIISGGSFLFQTFYELLAHLIGRSLTERLLLPVGTNLFSGTPVQDISS